MLPLLASLELAPLALDLLCELACLYYVGQVRLLQDALCQRWAAVVSFYSDLYYSSSCQLDLWQISLTA